MLIHDVALRVAEALDRAQVPFMLVGGFSVEGWCDRHGTRAVLEEIRRTVPKL
jgi:hypothetical protein